MDKNQNQNMPGIDPAKLTPDQRDKLEMWQIAQDSKKAIDDLKTQLGGLTPQMNVNLSNLDEHFKPIQDLLQKLNDKEAPALPEFDSQPIVDGLAAVESALKAIKVSPELKPNIKVAAPNVQVDAPVVDLSGIERSLKKDLPAAFAGAVALIPEAPETDFQPVLDALDGLAEKLNDIDKGVRLKPQPGSVSVSSINNGQPLSVTQTAATIPIQTTLQNGAKANQTGDYINVTGQATALLNVLSSTAMSGGTTINFEASVDGTNWTAIMAHGIGMGTLATTTTSDGDYRINVAGYNRLRARISGYSAGITTIIGYVSPSSGSSTLVGIATGTASIGAVTATGNVASGVTDSGNPVKVGGKYNLAAPTFTDGQRGDLQLDVNGNTKATLATLAGGEDLTASTATTGATASVGIQAAILKPVVSSSYAPLTYQQSGSVTKANIKATAGNVLMIRITNGNAAVRYFQLHNKATAPAAADTAQLYFIVPAGTATAPGVLTLGINELTPTEYFATGIGWAISTTATTFTDSGTNTDHNTTVRYI